MMSENAPSSCEKTPENEFLIIVYKFVNQYITSSFWTICTLLKIGGGKFLEVFSVSPLHPSGGLRSAMPMWGTISYEFRTDFYLLTVCCRMDF